MDDYDDDDMADMVRKSYSTLHLPIFTSEKVSMQREKGAIWKFDCLLAFTRFIAPFRGTN